MSTFSTSDATPTPGNVNRTSLLGSHALRSEASDPSDGTEPSERKASGEGGGEMLAPPPAYGSVLSNEAADDLRGGGQSNASSASEPVPSTLIHTVKPDEKVPVVVATSVAV